MRIREVGTRALLLDCADGDEVEAWRAELWHRRDTGELTAGEIVPAARTLLLDDVPDPVSTAGDIARWTARPTAGPVDAAVVPITVRYDGIDLPWVAQRWAVSVDEAVTRLCAAPLRVAFCGFAPGFAYLSGLPLDAPVPRLATPRTRVPAGSVGLAGPYVGIYPNASPGGWRLVGSTDARLFDVDRDPPALLVPGTPVRLVSA